MTATTTRGVKCGNCGSYHVGSEEVRQCYQGTSPFEKAVRDARWDGSNTSKSPLAQYPKATDKQITFLSTLRQERGFGSVQEAAKAMGVHIHGDGMTKAQASELIDLLMKAPKTTANGNGHGHKLPDVPAGHYAIPSLTGNNDLDFFRVDRPTEGRNKGRTYVKRIVGGRPSQNIVWSQYSKVLQAILDYGQDKAARLYGHELGQCYRCNRHLTDATSRSLGIGPDCRSK